MTIGIEHCDEVLCAASEERLALGVWHGEPTLEHMNVLDDMLGARVRSYSKVLLLIIVERPVLPPEEARMRMVEVMARYREALVAIGVVIEVPGMFGTALRALSRGVVVASRSRTPTYFASSVAEALDALTPALLQVNLDAARAQGIVSEVRQRYTSSFQPSVMGELRSFQAARRATRSELLSAAAASRHKSGDRNKW